MNRAPKNGLVFKVLVSILGFVVLAGSAVGIFWRVIDHETKGMTKCLDDHEIRIRAVERDVTAIKVTTEETSRDVKELKDYIMEDAR